MESTALGRARDSQGFTLVAGRRFPETEHGGAAKFYNLLEWERFIRDYETIDLRASRTLAVVLFVVPLHTRIGKRHLLRREGGRGSFVGRSSRAFREMARQKSTQLGLNSYRPLPPGTPRLWLRRLTFMVGWMPAPEATGELGTMISDICSIIHCPAGPS